MQKIFFLSFLIFFSSSLSFAESGKAIFWGDKGDDVTLSGNQCHHNSKGGKGESAYVKGGNGGDVIVKDGAVIFGPTSGGDGGNGFLKDGDGGNIIVK